MYMCIHSHACVHMDACICVHACLHEHTIMHMHVHAHNHAYACTCTQSRTCMYTHGMHSIYLQTANSQRMAELLGGDVGGVIGFEAVSRRRYSESFRPAGMDNSELQVVLKQLGKRDTTTKLKVRGQGARSWSKGEGACCKDQGGSH